MDCASSYMRLALVCFAAQIACAAGCSEDRSPQVQLELDPALPLVELPLVDLSADEPPLEAQPSPKALGRSLPGTDFNVRFEALREAGVPAPPHGVVLLYRRSGDRLGTVGQGFVKLLDREGKELIYQGTCFVPNRSGEAMLELRIGSKCYLVRSTHFAE
jgi:hypothetical protein